MCAWPRGLKFLDPTAGFVRAGPNPNSQPYLPHLHFSPHFSCAAAHLHPSSSQPSAPGDARSAHSNHPSFCLLPLSALLYTAATTRVSVAKIRRLQGRRRSPAPLPRPDGILPNPSHVDFDCRRLSVDAAAIAPLWPDPGIPSMRSHRFAPLLRLPVRCGCRGAGMDGLGGGGACENSAVFGVAGSGRLSICFPPSTHSPLVFSSSQFLSTCSRRRESGAQASTGT